MIGQTVGATGILGAGVMLLLWRTRWPLSEFALRGAIVCISMAAAGIYLVGAANWYRTLGTQLAADKTISAAEADFFAVQTMTTVGYGIGLTAFDDCTAPSCKDAFKGGANWAMLLGSCIWGFVIGATANVFLAPYERKNGQ